MKLATRILSTFFPGTKPQERIADRHVELRRLENVPKTGPAKHSLGPCSSFNQHPISLPTSNGISHPSQQQLRPYCHNRHGESELSRRSWKRQSSRMSNRDHALPLQPTPPQLDHPQLSQLWRCLLY